MFKFIVLSALVALACGAPHVRSTLPQLDGRIIGGSTTTIDNYPYQISLLYGGSHICGGSLISTRYVVTAAHCTAGSSASYLSIRAGSSYRTSGGQVISVSTIYQNPSYSSSTIDYDVSVLYLSSAVTTSAAGTIGLAASGSSVATGATATVTGWGTTSEGGSAATQLQVVQVPIVSQATCRSAYGTSAITDRMLCAGYTSGGYDACQGDSGGPLVVSGLLTGIVSWGYGCARPNYPGVYSSVPALRSYIDSVVS